MKKSFIIIIILIVVFFLILFFYFFVGKAPVQKNITWGVDFSQSQSEYLKLDWKKVYLAIINDLRAKNIKLHTNWSWVEGKRDDYYFSDIDWQVSQAEKNDVKMIYVVGMKTGRWPECHVPVWANGLSKQEQQTGILEYIKEVVLRYKDSPAIINWQVENEPLFKFGECPWYDKDFLKKEVELIKSLDPSRQIIISDSGEQSNWFEAAKIGDIVGTTLYRNGWAHVTDNVGFYFYSPLPPVHYWRKAQLIRFLFDKDVIGVELQAEPWTPKSFFDASTSEWEKTMSFEQFKSNIVFAKQTGFDTFYLWGVEWWYWLKEKQKRPEIWQEAQKLFNI